MANTNSYKIIDEIYEITGNQLTEWIIQNRLGDRLLDIESCQLIFFSDSDDYVDELIFYTPCIELTNGGKSIQGNLLHRKLE